MSHYFKFSINWRAGKRLCGECGMTYSAGSHILIDKLKPYTSYVCPSGGGTGHSSRYTGAYDMGELRSPTDHVCICGLDLVEEDNESWLLSYETRPATGQKWQPVSITRSKHAAHQQLEGLLALIDQGEQIRSVSLRRSRS